MTDTTTLPAAAKLPARLPTQLMPAGHHWSEHQHVAPAGVTLANVVNPAYWQHVTAFLRLRDAITVVAADNSFEVKLRVTNADKGALRLRIVYGDAAPEAEPESEENENPFDVNFVPQQKWRVIERATKDVVAKDFGTREEAEHARDNLIAARKAA